MAHHNANQHRAPQPTQPPQPDLKNWREYPSALAPNETQAFQAFKRKELEHERARSNPNPPPLFAPNQRVSVVLPSGRQHAGTWLVAERELKTSPGDDEKCWKYVLQGGGPDDGGGGGGRETEKEKEKERRERGLVKTWWREDMLRGVGGGGRG
ncbi:hypothetical protein K490DRAFT_68293 [Saccharata proteae CBS 121410]|uniref:Uncharacterized protein n=1 Tax=Saccharata proteae CBS 121410 TaxID=1314787 RepID=A0A9P4HNE0_9PEZI|nr:hypothetical protein K490DRAFT_68293 [Saccharata proteae CBS 121410]